MGPFDESGVHTVKHPLPGLTVIVSCDYKPLRGGIATYLYRLAEAIAAGGGEVEVWAPPVEGAAAFDAAQMFTTIRTNCIRMQGLPDYRLVAGLGAAIRNRNARRIISGLWLQTGAAAALASSIWRVPFYQICYGIELLDAPRTAMATVKRWLRRTVLSRAAQVWAISRYTESLAKTVAPRSSTRIVPPGIEKARFAAPTDPRATKRRWGVAGRSLILTVARLEDYKGIDRMLEAMPTIATGHSGAVYLIVGDGPYREQLHQMIGERQLETSAILTGPLPDEDVVALYKACDLYVMPSRMTKDPPNVEGFGISFLEASACGKPVVGGLSGGIPDAVADGMTGLLVAPEDPAAIAQAVLTLLRDPVKARTMGAAGRLMANARGWDAVGAQAVQFMSEPWP
jgi:phosphatidylinositol alpha-1,6-mannosyltransferase